MKFRPGDVVRCIDAPRNFYITVGHTYVVAENMVNSEGSPCIRIENNGGDLAMYYSSRFEYVCNPALLKASEEYESAIAGIEAYEAMK